MMFLTLCYHQLILQWAYIWPVVDRFELCSRHWRYSTPWYDIVQRSWNKPLFSETTSLTFPFNAPLWL